MVFEKVCELLSEQFAVDANTMTMDTRFGEDLGADSLDFVDLMMGMEETFDLPEVPEEDVAKIKTIGDLVRYIETMTD